MAFPDTSIYYKAYLKVKHLLHVWYWAAGRVGVTAGSGRVGVTAGSGRVGVTTSKSLFL